MATPATISDPSLGQITEVEKSFLSGIGESQRAGALGSIRSRLKGGYAQSEADISDDIRRAYGVSTPSQFRVGLYEQPLSAGSLQLGGLNPPAASNADAQLASLVGSFGLPSQYSLPRLPGPLDYDPQAWAQARAGRQSAIEQLGKAGETLKAFPQRRAELEAQYKIPELTSQISELDAKIAQRMAEFESGINRVEGETIPQGLIVGAQAQIRRQQATEVGLLQAQRQAAFGNLSLAQDLATRTSNAEYQAALGELQQAREFIDINKQFMDDEERKLARQVQTALDLREKEINRTYAERAKNQDLMLEIAKAGGDVSTIDPTASFETNLAKVGSTFSQANSFDEYVKSLQLGAQLSQATGDTRFLDQALRGAPGIDAYSGTSSPSSFGAEQLTGRTVGELSSAELDGVLAAMAKQEGYRGKYGAENLQVAFAGEDIPANLYRAERNNNPLNITVPSRYIQNGQPNLAQIKQWTKATFGIEATGVDPSPGDGGLRYLQFKDLTSGWNAARSLIRSDVYRNLPLDKALSVWSGGGYNSSILKGRAASGAAQTGAPDAGQPVVFAQEQYPIDGTEISSLYPKDRDSVLNFIKEKSAEMTKGTLSREQAIFQVKQAFPQLSSASIAAQVQQIDPKANPKVKANLAGLDRAFKEIQDLDRSYQALAAILTKRGQQNIATPWGRVGLLMRGQGSIGLPSFSFRGITIPAIGWPIKQSPEAAEFLNRADSLAATLAQTVGTVSPLLSNSGARGLSVLLDVYKGSIPKITDDPEVVIRKFRDLYNSIGLARQTVLSSADSMGIPGGDETASSE